VQTKKIAISTGAPKSSQSSRNDAGHRLASRLQYPLHMKTASRTYDEITRRTVPDPDSSFRPPRPPDTPQVIELRARVVDALQSIGCYDIGFDIDGAHVILRGEARDVATRDRIERLVAGVGGVERVECKIHVA
jgi:hypothetical protein